ncbi:MAG: hypothetical protein LBC97_01380 [Bifidobacteriaceae bacterium]|jgi:hypothetical protein|nr:hypothetical protein [Bifidobacteriaceae bacterium]
MSDVDRGLDEIAEGLVREGAARLHSRLADYGRAARYDGPCPRCGHSLSQTRPVSLIVFGMRGGAAAEPPGYADFACDCGLEAAGGGCGATFSLELDGEPA